jgi:hypothetical protein
MTFVNEIQLELMSVYLFYLFLVPFKNEFTIKLNSH